MTRKRRLVLSAVAAVGLILSVFTIKAVAQDAASHPADHTKAKGALGQLFVSQLESLKALGASLNLTDQQKTQIKDICMAHKQDAAPLLKELVAKRRALQDAVVAQPTDESAIRKAADDVGKAIGDAAVKAAGVAGEIRKVLTPDQIELIAANTDEREAAIDNFLDQMSKMAASAPTLAPTKQ